MDDRRMVTAAFTFADIGIIAGTALVGGLVIDLHKRLAQHLLLRAGAALLLLGWIATLAMTASGPFPHRIGAAVGGGLFLAGIALLLPAAQRNLGARRRPAGRDRHIR